LKQILTGPHWQSVLGSLLGAALGLAAWALVQHRLEQDELDRDSADPHRRSQLQ
jgi:hypothetical protein